MAIRTRRIDGSRRAFSSSPPRPWSEWKIEIIGGWARAGAGRGGGAGAGGGGIALRRASSSSLASVSIACSWREAKRGGSACSPPSLSLSLSLSPSLSAQSINNSRSSGRAPCGRDEPGNEVVGSFLIEGEDERERQRGKLKEEENEKMKKNSFFSALSFFSTIKPISSSKHPKPTQTQCLSSSRSRRTRL